MSLCPLTLKAIGCQVDSEISFFCLVTHLVEDEDQYYICVGERAFYFMDKSFDKVRGKVNYSQLLRIIVDSYIPSLLQMHLSENREANMPLKMNFLCIDRKFLTYYISYSWKTFYMYNLLQVKDLPIYQQNIKIQNKTKLEMQGPPSFLFQSKKEKDTILENRIIIKEYVFLIHNQFNNAQTGYYVLKQNAAETQLFLQVSDALPIQAIKQINRESLEQYAISYMETITREYGVKKFFIKKSKPYEKRHNFVEEKSEWKGWEMVCATNMQKLKQVSIIIIRRKFLPPFLENFQDIIMVMFQNNSASTSKKQIELRQISDSIYSVNFQCPLYIPLIQEKCNALAFEEEGYNFLMRQNPLILPQAIIYAFQIIRYMRNKLLGTQKKELIREEVINTRLAFYQEFLNVQEKEQPNTHKTFRELIASITDSIQKQFNLQEQAGMKVLKPKENDSGKPAQQRNDSIRSEPKDENKVAQAPQELGERTSFEVTTAQTQFFSFDSHQWKKKISKYLTFCIDGGIFGDSFSLVQIIEGVADAGSKKDCLDLLEYCLFMFNEEGGINFAGVTKSIEKSIQNLTNFNERVMIQLIKNHFFYQVYLESDSGGANTYQQLMMYFLVQHPSINIKKAVCYHLIDRLKKKNDDQAFSDSVQQVFLELTPALIYLYQKTPEISLKVYACIALQNILLQIRDAKITITQHNGAQAVLDGLDSPHQKIVNYSLRFVNNLCDGKSGVPIFNMEQIQEKAIQIITGYKGMSDYHYSVEVTVTALQLVQKLLTLKDSNLSLIHNSFGKIYKLIEPVVNKTVKESNADYYCDLELQEEVYSTICMLVNRDKTILDEMAKFTGKYGKLLIYSIDLVINLVSGILLEKALQLIITLCQEREDLTEYLQDNQLFYNAIKFLYFDSKIPNIENSSLGRKLQVALFLFNIEQPEEINDGKRK